MRVAMLGAVSRKMIEGVTNGVFPGAVLLVFHRGEIIHHEAYGFAALLPEKRKMERDTIFDLASLTKPVATAAAMRLLDERGLLTLHEEARRILPEWKKGRGVTLLHLLTHSSGLPAWRPFFEGLREEQVGREGEARRVILQSVCKESLLFPPGSQRLYSDLGYFLLGEIVERVAGRPLDLFCREEIFAPLGMRDTFFIRINTSRGRRPASHFASTEACPWRKRIMVGEVHDENAYALGGVSGHAGLFSTARDLFLFVTHHPRAWTPGWDTPSPPSSSGQFFSSSSFGHLGFTGTSLWVDPEKELGVVLLTNRVHPTRANDTIKEFRPLLHDLVWTEVG